MAPGLLWRLGPKVRWDRGGGGSVQIKERQFQFSFGNVAFSLLLVKKKTVKQNVINTTGL